MFRTLRPIPATLYLATLLRGLVEVFNALVGLMGPAAPPYASLHTMTFLMLLMGAALVRFTVLPVFGALVRERRVAMRTIVLAELGATSLAAAGWLLHPYASRLGAPAIVQMDLFVPFLCGFVGAAMVWLVRPDKRVRARVEHRLALTGS